MTRAQTLSDEVGGPAGHASAKASHPATVEPLRAVLASEAGDSARAWLRLAQKRYTNGVRGLILLSQCRTPQDFLAARADLLCEDLELIRAECEGVGEIVAATASEAVRVIEAKRGG